MANEFVAKNGLISQNSVTITGSVKLTDVNSSFNIVGNAFGQTYLQSPNGALVLNPGYGGVNINGANPNLKVDGTLTTDGNATIVNAYIGTIPAFGSNYMAFSHTSRATTGDYSLLSDNAGITYLNAKAGQSLRFRIDNTDKAIIDSSGNLTIGKTTAANALLDVNGNAIVTGSLTVTGGITGSFTGSFVGTGSYANQALSSSYSQTASYAPNYLPLTGGTINGNVTVNGTASISFLNVTYETASVIYSSGSNQFGDAADDTQLLYGSVRIPTGSLTVSGSLIVTGSITGSLLGTASYAQVAKPTGPNAAVQFNKEGILTGSSGLTYFNGTLTVNGDDGNPTITVDNGSSTTTILATEIAIGGASLLSQGTGTSVYIPAGQSFTTLATSVNSQPASLTGDVTLSTIPTASYVTSSFFRGANAALSASYATTASYAINAGSGTGFPFSGSGVITGSLLISGAVPNTGLIISGTLNVTGGITGSVAGYVANAATSSFVNNSATSSFVQNSVTSSMTVASASYVTSSFFTGINAALSASYALSSSYAVSASYVPNISAFPYVGAATVTGSLLVLGTGSVAFTAFMTSSVVSQSFFLVAGTVRNSGSLSSSVYGVNISPTLQYITQSQTATALRVTPTFISGSTAVSNSVNNIIADLGTIGAGSQFVVNDITSGSVYQINTTSGLPLVDMSSDWIYRIYNYPTVIFQTSGSAVTISGSLKVSGSLDAQVLSSSYALTASYALNGGTGGSGTGFPFSGSGTVTGSLLISGAISTEGLIVSGPIASTGTITAPTFAGSLSGNATSANSATSATTATNTTNVGITNTNTNAEHYIAFSAANSGNQPVRVDSVGLKYNPSTEILTVVGGITASLAGTSSWAISSSQALTASYLVGGVTPGLPLGPESTYQFKQGSNISGSPVLSFVDNTAGIVATGSFTGSLTGRLIGTSSWASNAITASYITSSFFTGVNTALSSSFTTTASYAVSSSAAVTASYAVSSSFAVTASYIPPGLLPNLVSSIQSGGPGIGISSTGAGGTGIVTVSNTGVVALQNGTSITVVDMGGGTWKINAGGTFQTNGQTLAIISGVSNLF